MSANRDERDAANPRQGDAWQSPDKSIAGGAESPPVGSHDTLTRLAESPWFWVALFGVGALGALLASSPKYGLRQGAIETKFQNRERAIQWEGQQVESVEAIDRTRLPRSPDERSLLIPLWPLMLFVGSVVVFAIARLWMRELCRRPRANEPNVTPSQGNTP